MKYIAIVLLIIFITGCASAITQEEIAEYKEFCNKETIIAVEPERTLVIESCVNERIKEEREYLREVRNAKYIEEYYLQEMMCRKSGGAMVIERRYGVSRLNNNKPPTRGERYGCMSATDLRRIMREVQQ